MTLKAEIITIGTELLMGEVIDTNTAYIARELNEMSISCYYHSTIGDNPKRMMAAVKRASERSNLIILAGGLGPTRDDITKSIVAEYLGKNLVEHELAANRIKSFYEDYDHIPLGNLKQAQVIEDSKPLVNEVGMATGVFYHDEDTGNTYVLLPGPPSELTDMFQNALKPMLATLTGETLKFSSRTLYLFGLTESMLGEILDDLIQSQANPTLAIYAEGGLLSVRMTASGDYDLEMQELLDQKEAEILDRVAPYFIGYEKLTPMEQLAKKLEKENSQVFIYETVTFGAFTYLLNQQNLEPRVVHSVIGNHETKNQCDDLFGHTDFGGDQSDLRIFIEGSIIDDHPEAKYPVKAEITLKISDKVYKFSVDHRHRQNSNRLMMSQYIAHAILGFLTDGKIVETFEVKMISDNVNTPNICSE